MIKIKKFLQSFGVQLPKTKGRPMKISDTLRDPGTAKVQEDGLVNAPPYYGATDGVSGVYLPQEGPRMFYGLTGGQLASQVIVDTFENRRPATVELGLMAANERLQVAAHDAGVSLGDPAFLPGACFAICKVGPACVNVVQGGDTLAVWRDKDGTLGGTTNWNFKYEKFLTDEIARLMEKHGGDRQKMWEEFRPILIQERRQYCSKHGLCLLNGRHDFLDRRKSFDLSVELLRDMILFTDGLAPFEETVSVDRLAKYVFRLYDQGGLRGVLAETHLLARKEAGKTHETLQEVAAIALAF